MSGILLRVGIGLSVGASVIVYAACRLGAQADEAIAQIIAMRERAREP